MHGIGGHAEAYSRNIRRLSGHFRTVAVDLVWHGFSSKPPVPRSMIPVYVDQILDLMDDLGCERVSLEGESLGGWIALEMALSHPDRLDKMVLNTAYGVRLKSDAASEDVRRGAAQLRERSIAAISNPTRDVVRKRLEWLMASPDRVTEELVDIRHAIYAMPETQASLRAVFEASFDPDHVPRLIEEERLAAIRTPTLVLWTDKNPGTGPDGGARLSQLIPGSRFHCITDAAHWPQWEKPEEHDRAVLDFLCN
jgi:pimeloyl-ACP methyl ester carboxylesterase